MKYSLLFLTILLTPIAYASEKTLDGENLKYRMLDASKVPVQTRITLRKGVTIAEKFLEKIPKDMNDDDIAEFKKIVDFVGYYLIFIEKPAHLAMRIEQYESMLAGYEKLPALQKTIRENIAKHTEKRSQTTSSANTNSSSSQACLTSHTGQSSSSSTSSSASSSSSSTSK